MKKTTCNSVFTTHTAKGSRMKRFIISIATACCAATGFILNAQVKHSATYEIGRLEM